MAQRKLLYSRESVGHIEVGWPNQGFAAFGVSGSPCAGAAGTSAPPPVVEPPPDDLAAGFTTGFAGGSQPINRIDIPNVRRSEQIAEVLRIESFSSMISISSRESFASE